LGLLVYAVPRHVELLGEVELEQPVVAQHLERHLLAGRGELHAAVGHVLGQAELGELLDHPRGRSGSDVQAVGEVVGGDRLAGAALERVDRLRVVLDGLGRAHHTATSRLVANISSSPASRPAIAGGCSVRPDSLRSDGASWTITCTIAPAPNPNRKAARLALNAAAPIHAPSTAGAPAIKPSSRSRRGVGCRLAIGATIASPSVVLCSA